MILVAMLKECRDELVCDMVETYRIYDMKAHPASFIATLAAGLRETSRTRMKMEGQRLSNTDSLLTLTFDKLNWLCWTKTKDAEHNINRPESLFDVLMGTDNKDAVCGFDSPEAFERKRRELLGE